MEIDMITIQEVCAKELGDNLQDERPCRPAFSKPCHVLSFWVPLGRKMFKFYEGGREVMFNAWMLEEVNLKPLKERDPRGKEEFTFTAKLEKNANKTATKIC
jgi:hypothetical protein